MRRVDLPPGHRAGQAGRTGSPRPGRRPRAPGDPPREYVASRVSAYVYGNVLVMAALIALHPDELEGPRGVLYLLGAGISTYVAHAVGEAVGLRVREGRTLDRAALRHELRAASPIVTSTGVPVVVLVLAWTDLVDASLVLVLALALVDVRLALLGSVVAWVSGERSSRRVFLAGFVLAVVAAGAALLKWQLTH